MTDFITYYPKSVGSAAHYCWRPNTEHCIRHFINSKCGIFRTMHRNQSFLSSFAFRCFASSLIFTFTFTTFWFLLYFWFNKNSSLSLLFLAYICIKCQFEHINGVFFTHRHSFETVFNGIVIYFMPNWWCSVFWHAIWKMKFDGKFEMREIYGSGEKDIIFHGETCSRWR